MRKRTFMVGRTTGRNTLVVFVSILQGSGADSPIAGPWTVRAVVSTN
jgi:hypothetical protein